MKKINQFIKKNIESSFMLQTRIHSLATYMNQENAYVKREDELSSGISGSKLRKYASILPFLVREKYHEIVLVGGENSNNIIGILQILNERGIKSKLFLLQKNHTDLIGNSLWLRLLSDEKKINWIKRKDWPQVEQFAQKYAHQQKHKVLVLSEGGDHFSAIAGGMTLAQDIIRNETENNILFNDIYIDSGTGITSIAMILYFLIIGQSRHFHITLIAGSQKEYIDKLNSYAKSLKEKTCIFIDTSLCNLHFYLPVTASSFGAVNTNIISEIKSIAINAGILADPIYSVKHFMTVKKIITQKNSLIIYNGGSFGLSGFQRKIRLFLEHN